MRGGGVFAYLYICKVCVCVGPGESLRLPS